MTQCTRYGKENVDVHTCTPLPTTPVGGTVEGDWIYKAFDEFYEKCDEPREECRRIFHEVIEKHMPTPKSQEAVTDVDDVSNHLSGCKCEGCEAYKDHDMLAD